MDQETKYHWVEVEGGRLHRLRATTATGRWKTVGAVGWGGRDCWQAYRDYATGMGSVYLGEFSNTQQAKDAVMTRLLEEALGR